MGPLQLMVSCYKQHLAGETAMHWGVPSKPKQFHPVKFEFLCFGYLLNAKGPFTHLHPPPPPPPPPSHNCSPYSQITQAQENHEKGTGMLIISLRDVNFGSRCSRQNAIIFSCEGLVLGCMQRNSVFFICLCLNGLF